MKFFIESRAIQLCFLIVVGAIAAGLVAPASTASRDLWSAPAAATANAGPDLTVYAGESVRLDGTASWGMIAAARWTTGDGHTIDSILKAPHAYQTPGTYTATLTVVDSAGIASTDTTTVTVRPIESTVTVTLANTGDPEANKRNLQAALNAAALDRRSTEIVVPAGMVINDTIYMPARDRAFGTYVTVRSSRSAELPAGTRVTRADRAKMFRINAQPAGSPGGVEQYAILIRPGTHYFRFVGVDVVRTGPATSYKNDVVGVSFDWNTSARPSHFILDRAIIDGNGTGVTRAYAPNGSEFSLLNSSIYDIKSPGSESKAIGMWSGAGNLAVLNNYLEAASINTLIGGAYTDVTNIPDGIVFRGNDSWKNPAWMNADGTGRGYAIKNLFELKSGINVVADGNTFENNWADAQAGSSILFTVRGDGQPEHTIRNVSFRRNTVRNVRAGVNILPSDYYEPTLEVQNLYIEHNRFLGVGDRALLLLPQGGEDGGGNNIHFKHNTVRMNQGAGTVVTMDGADGMQIFIESNDFGYIGDYGVFGSGAGEGAAAITAYLTDDSTFRRNLISFYGRSSTVSPSYAMSRYPAEYETYFSYMNADSYNADGTPFSYIVGTDGAVVGAGTGAATAPIPTPTPTPTPTPIPTPSATPTPAPTPSATPTPKPTPSATPTPTPTPSATPTPTPTPTPRPGKGNNGKNNKG